MSKIHVLTADDRGGYTVALHFPVPGGNNSANVSWKNALLNSGIGGSTVLAEGTGPGQISPAEKADIEAGNVVELVTVLKVDSAGATAAQVTALADKEIASYQSLLASKLKYFGYEQVT